MRSLEIQGPKSSERILLVLTLIAYAAVCSFSVWAPMFPARDRSFATSDWAPTLVELSGGVLPAEGAFGLGRSQLRENQLVRETLPFELYGGGYANHTRIIGGWC